MTAKLSEPMQNVLMKLGTGWGWDDFGVHGPLSYAARVRTCEALQNVIATFATPILLGRTLPVKDQVTDRSGVLTGVALALTPKEVVSGKVIVLLAGNLTKRSKSSVIGWGVTTPATAVEIPNTTTESFHNQVVLAQGQSQVIPFGNCKLAEGKPPSCSHKLVLNASSQ
ncbi:hypothetical protein [Pseudomonas syringae group sp. J254-4]|uniref:hypothetical protein n=1 Tax=Pseudomonas syringae group sp. J254-4 TaxID=3079589 RepID=UPI0029096CB1|nr:hypothetical protein [Pseudomonas syringae group sp. J254-4]MDU8456765.1 hypothetical protein [Pseudomonas syringae group sp. J254-4]